jgi:hypothetical protein
VAVVPNSGGGVKFFVMYQNFSGGIYEKLPMFKVRDIDSTK